MPDEPATDDVLRARATDALRHVIDPEIGIDVVELGLVYGVDVHGGDVRVLMTMTSPACPLGEQILEEAYARLFRVDGVGEVEIELVWEPPWTPDRMSPAAKEALGWAGP